jgi:hypothetical protein
MSGVADGAVLREAGAELWRGLRCRAPMALASAFSPAIRGRDAELGELGELLAGAFGFGCGSADRGSGRYGEEPPAR